MEENDKKAITKSLSEIRRDIENATEEELEYLRNHTRYNKTPAYLESMQNDLLSKPDKPVIFEKPVFILDHALLVKQFNTIDKTRKDLVLHDFKKDSKLYRSLYQWSGFQLTQDLFAFVHYQLYGKLSVLNNSNTKERESGKEGEVLDLTMVKNLQRVLIESSTRVVKQYRTRDIMRALENLLDSNLTQIILHLSQVIFVLEWLGLEDGKFRTLISFRYHSQSLASLLKTKTDPLKPLVLDGEDLYDNFLERESSLTENEEKMSMVIEGLNLMKVRQLLRDSQLAYSYYGFSQR